eukprot:scaffold10501_cov141-Amphora_coffeaeformis.AAC.10
MDRGIVLAFDINVTRADKTSNTLVLCVLDLLCNSPPMTAGYIWSVISIGNTTQSLRTGCEEGEEESRCDLQVQYREKLHSCGESWQTKVFHEGEESIL